MILFLSLSLAAADSVADLYRQYQSVIFRNGVYCVSQTIFSMGNAKIIGNPSIASVSARMDAQSKILTFLQQQIKVSGKPAFVSEQVAKMALDEWLNKTKRKYSMQNIRQVETVQRDGKIYVVLAVKVQDIVNPYPSEIIWQQLIQEYTAMPDKNSLLLYEIYDQRDLASHLPEIETGLIKLYGKNFALVFFGKNATAADSSDAKEQKILLPSLTVKAPLSMLIRAINLLAYEPTVLKLAAEKFDALGMPRCAAQMKKAFVIAEKKAEENMNKTSTQNK